MITTILIFIFVLGLLVFVHELGHFTMAKAFGMGVDEFGFGFPPRIAGIKKGGTLYSINWIPLGGFVKIHGENGMIPIDEMIVNYKEKGKANINEKELKEETKFISNLFPEFSLKKPSYEDLADFLKNKKDHLDKTAFYTKPIWQRFIVLIAGVFMNVVLCAILLSVGYMIGFPSALENLPANARVSDENIVVLQIEEGLPAQNAGLAEGDIIISANNQ
ncbi:site-2 protease family protein [Patescibacteria group bacterium]|nr:site-2 protease family protein [Patescibacteria group bacterium]